jgi:hypothetical protein
MKDIFQSDEFYSFLEGTGYLEPFRFSVYRSDREVGRIQGFIQRDGGALKRYLSRRAIINGGPWFAEDVTGSEVESVLKECVKGLRKRVIYIEIRNYRDYSAYNNLFSRNGFKLEPHYDFWVETEDDAWQKRMESSRLRFVKASLKNGASIIQNPTSEDVTSFYSVLKSLYTEKIKKPLFPLEFFTELQKMPFCKYILVQYQERVIGGMLCVYDKEATYEWYVCGLDGVYKNIYPSILATYSAIQFAAESGCKRFDMMGAGAPGDGGYGVREFKAKFGGELKEFGRFKYVSDKFLYNVGKVGVSLMKRL